VTLLALMTLRCAYATAFALLGVIALALLRVPATPALRHGEPHCRRKAGGTGWKLRPGALEGGVGDGRSSIPWLKLMSGGHQPGCGRRPR